jgi:hypothetical protein
MRFSAWAVGQSAVDEALCPVQKDIKDLKISDYRFSHKAGRTETEE